jgi:hypothetical protein
VGQRGGGERDNRGRRSTDGVSTPNVYYLGSAARDSHKGFVRHVVALHKTGALGKQKLGILSGPHPLAEGWERVWQRLSREHTREAQACGDACCRGGGACVLPEHSTRLRRSVWDGGKQGACGTGGASFLPLSLCGVSLLL